MLDELLKKFGLKFEDLTAAERETYFTWIDQLERKQLSIQDIKNYLRRMIQAIELDLATEELHSKQDRDLKARLKNYILLEAFLDSPEQARRAIERQLSAITKKSKVDK